MCLLLGFLFRFCVSVNLNAIFEEEKTGNSASSSVVLKSCQAMKQFPRCRCHFLNNKCLFCAVGHNCYKSVKVGIATTIRFPQYLLCLMTCPTEFSELFDVTNDNVLSTS
jgi:hypothetical protein